MSVPVLDFNSKRELIQPQVTNFPIQFTFQRFEIYPPVDALKISATEGFEKIKYGPRLIRQLEMMTPNVIHLHP